MDPVWYEDPRVLFGPRFYEFVPTAGQTFEERINALTRFAIYGTILLYILRRNPRHVAIGIAVVAVLAIVNYTRSLRTNGRESFDGGEETAAFADYWPSKKRTCVRPTLSNPFGNVLPTDIADDPAREAACAYDDIKEEVRDAFNDKLYRNLNDVYEKANSQRQFHTMPSTTVPNDVDAFRSFVYGIRKNCKTDPSQCTGYD